MRVMTPDATLVEIADRLAAVPQRRGVPLPLVLMPLAYLEPVGQLLTGASMAAASAWMGGLDMRMQTLAVAALFAGGGALGLARAAPTARGRARDGRAWSPELAARYRADALALREGVTALRTACVVLAVLLGLFAAWIAARVPSAVLAMPMVAVTLAMAGRLVESYACCAFPRDPDLLAPVPA